MRGPPESSRSAVGATPRTIRRRSCGFTSPAGIRCSRYEVYGPGPLSVEDERRYWAESRIAAELQTCDPADVPRDRDEVRAYYERVRPGLCVSERALRGMHYHCAPTVTGRAFS